MWVISSYGVRAWLERCFFYAFVAFLCNVSGLAHAANVQIQVDLDQSGGIVGPLNTIGDDFCSTGATPGCDISSSDNRIRTNDVLSYDVSLQVDPPGDDVFVRLEFKPGLIAGDLPGACDPFTSMVSGDGTTSSPSEIYCDLGFKSSWATTLTFFATVKGTVSNGTATGLESAEIGGSVSTTTSANLSLIGDQIVTAVPRINLRKQTAWFTARTRNGVSGVDMRYRFWVGLWDNDRNGNPSDNPDPRLGHENVTSAITFTEDMGAVAPNAYLVSCTMSNSAAFPYRTYDPIYPNRSVTDAGAVSCSNTGPSATGSQTVTLSGADLSLEHYPTQNRNGGSLPADYKFASFGLTTVFIPYSDIEDEGGSLVATNSYTNLNVLSVSGQSNFNGAGEDITDNVVSQTIENRGGSFSQTYRCFFPGTTPPAWCNTYWASAPTNASTVGAGNGVVEPEQPFVSYTYYRNLSFIGDTEADVCTVIDSRYVEPILASSGTPTYCAGQCGTLGTDYVIEYGNNYIATAWRDAATTPSGAVRDECNATNAQANWNTDFAAAQAAGPITKVRMRRLTPLNPSGTHALALNLAPLDPAGLTGVPNGTLIKTWGAAKATTSWADYRNCSYKSGSYPAPSHSRNGCGDRLALTRALARIEKTTQPANATNVVEAGGQVTFELTPNFTSVGGSITENVQIIDELPIGTEYVAGSATQGGSPFPPVLTGNISTGQVLTWDLGTVQVNVPIPSIEFTMSVPSYTAGGTQLVNTARIETIADISDDALRTDTRAVTVTAPKSMLMNKTVDAPNIEKDGTLLFTVTYDNATNAPFSEVDVIDVLPFTGDGRFPATDFSGQTELSGITTNSSSIQFYVTKDVTSGLSSDPQITQNNLTSGSTKWCPMTSSHTINPSATPSSGGTSSQCPANGNQVTALRLIDTDTLVAGDDRSFTFALITNGNVGDDIYTNQAQGTADTISLSPLSPFATAAVSGVGIIEAVKTVAVWDPANQNLYAIPGNEVIYTFTVKNIGDGKVDQNSMILIDNLPPELEFWNGDIDAGGPDTFPGTDPIGFLQTIGTGVTFDAATDLRFRTGSTPPENFSQCATVASDATFRPDLTHICLNPKGTLSNGDPDPTIELSLRARIK